MYTVYVDSHLLYSSTLANEDYVIYNPSLKMELNKAPSFSCVIAQANPNADKITKLKSELLIFEDGNRIFRGRVLTAEKDFYGQISIQAEGDINYLNDVALRPYSHTGSVEAYLRKLIHEYNIHVEEDKRFGKYNGSFAEENLDFGDCTVTDSNNTIVRANSEYVPIMDEINNKLLKLLGGYLFTRYVANDNATYIDYRAASGVQDDSQTIQFGENLLDLSEELSAEDVYTVIIPLGAKPEGGGENAQRLTVNDATIDGSQWGKDYIENASAVAKYGRIERTVAWDDVTDADNLYAKGKALVDAQGTEIKTIDVDAVDLHLMGLSAESLKLGNYYRIDSYPHGYDTDTWLQLAKVSLNLQSVSKNKYTFTLEYRSSSFTSASRQTAANANDVSDVASAAANAKAEAAVAKANAAVATRGDYIEEVDSDSTWVWRKWHSGIAECWGVSSCSIPANGMSTLGSLFSFDGQEAFPAGLFVGAPVQELSPQTGTRSFWVGLRNTAVSASSAAYAILTTSNSANAHTVKVGIHAVGRWKQ